MKDDPRSDIHTTNIYIKNINRVVKQNSRINSLNEQWLQSSISKVIDKGDDFLLNGTILFVAFDEDV